MRNSYQDQVKTYFKNKAAKYDLVDNQSYWQLSDDLLWVALKEFASSLSANFKFLDAGGGTGRWTMKLLQYFHESTGLLFDLSPDMMIIAEEKRSANALQDRLKLVQGDLMELSNNVASDFDFAYNFHNVLGFVDSPAQVVKNLAAVVKKGGYVVTLAPSLYHSIFFNISLGKVSAAAEIAKVGKGKFTNEMPEIHLFSPTQMEQLYNDAGLEVTTLTGFPSTIYPGFQETQLEGQTERLVSLLASQENYQTIFEIEKELMKKPDIAARGNNILIIGKKI